MIEIYAYLAAFAVKVLTLSVVYPAWFIRFTRASPTLSERVAQLYPGVDFSLTRERFLTRFRALNICIAVLGLILLGWLISYMQHPNSYDDRVKTLVTIHFYVLVLPFAYIGWVGIRHNQLLRRTSPARRTAVLQRRGLFDYISPFAVALAVVSYFLFAALVIYIRQNPFPGFGGYFNIAIITVGYAFFAFVMYAHLYGRKNHPLETNEERAYTIGVVVRTCVYSCTFVVVSLSFHLAIKQLDLERWAPFANSIFGTTVLLGLTALAIGTLRRPEADDGFSGDIGQQPAK